MVFARRRKDTAEPRRVAGAPPLEPVVKIAEPKLVVRREYQPSRVAQPRVGVISAHHGWWGGIPPRLADVIKAPSSARSGELEDGPFTSRDAAYRQYAKNAKHVFGIVDDESGDEENSPGPKRYVPKEPEVVQQPLQAGATRVPQARIDMRATLGGSQRPPDVAVPGKASLPLGSDFFRRDDGAMTGPDGGATAGGGHHVHARAAVDVTAQAVVASPAARSNPSPAKASNAPTRRAASRPEPQQPSTQTHAHTQRMESSSVHATPSAGPIHREQAKMTPGQGAAAGAPVFRAHDGQMVTLHEDSNRPAQRQPLGGVDASRFNPCPQPHGPQRFETCDVGWRILSPTGPS